ncbi:MAG: anaerobic ribonucleoside triphosphate reductase [Clostridiales bacterium]|nr:anaerobic ribonucleoside triphosphate reductase [Clostridiales bacterium]
MILSIEKRDGRIVPFEEEKIQHAIEKAFIATDENVTLKQLKAVLGQVNNDIEQKGKTKPPKVEEVQDLVEKALIDQGFAATAKAYILYRSARSKNREMNSRLMKTFEDISFKDSLDSDMKRENANINGDTAMGAMLRFGSEGAKQFYNLYVIKPEHSQAHQQGDIHIHDLDFYSLTTTCCQIDLLRLFDGGFSTGHGVLREPKNIISYAALACIAIQANQNDQHGGQSVVNFDYGMAPGVKKTFIRAYAENLGKALELLSKKEDGQNMAEQLIDTLAEEGLYPSLEENKGATDRLQALLLEQENQSIKEITTFAQEKAVKETVKSTYQAMKALIHNLNTMNSRAGAQVPFSSINYGMDTSPEGRLVIEQLLLATDAGLGRGETPIFPIQIFRVKEGVSYNPGDPNYDLFRLAIKTSAKRMFPNFSFLDAPFNAQLYKPGHPETEIAYMGCRTRVMANVHDPEKQVAPQRGNLSFTTINLPRLGIEAKGNLEQFFAALEEKMDLVVEQLLERFEVIARKKVKNFPFLMGEGIWIDSDTLSWNDEIREVIKHGTLSIGFIGLAETLKALTGKHHGESAESQELGLKIIGFMRAYTDRKAQETKMNFTLLATPAEGLSGRFIAMDKKRYGLIEGITDREYYTNSFHIPVYYPISAFDKIALEAPYHALTNAGHISYVEMDGDPLKNLDAFEKIIRCMHDQGIGYGSINHPIDRDSYCGYQGIIDDVCPSCGRDESEHPFDRIRRITGYLVGTLDRFNDAKKAEEKDRVKHGLSQKKQEAAG